MRAGLVLSFIALVGCGSGSDRYSRSGQALDLLPPELPVTFGLTGDTFSVNFSGEDADLSFAADTTRFTCFTTGGGWIPGGAGGKAVFGFIAGQPGATSGHLVLIDHSTGVRISGSVITSFTEVGPGFGFTGFDGTDDNGRPFAVQANDNGEPGAGRDSFFHQRLGPEWRALLERRSSGGWRHPDARIILRWRLRRGSPGLRQQIAAPCDQSTSRSVPR